MTGLLCYCRAGFEPELAAELGERAAELGFAGYARTERDSGLVIFHCDQAAELDAALPSKALIFARQKLQLLVELRDLDPSDRISPLLQALHGADKNPFASGAAAMAHASRSAPGEAAGRTGTQAVPGTENGLRQRPAYGSLVVEHPDSDAGKPLSGLARAFANAARPVFRKVGLLSRQDDPDLPSLHLCFVAGDHLLVARGTPGDSAPWPLGIPRLRMHADAPSRSALKLEEALLTLLDDDQRSRLLKPGMRAADLGAAPGGWTWVLTRNGLQVTAIDNGPLRPHVTANAAVSHLRADGFNWHPQQGLDWMVCDMVEQPRRVAERMGEWFAQGWCRQAIFNLKLPMKKRWQETRLCLDLFRQRAGAPLQISARQLYHDREEITVFASRVPNAE